MNPRRDQDRQSSIHLCHAIDVRAAVLVNRTTSGRRADVCLYRRHGKLDGKWRDCVIVKRLLGEAVANSEAGPGAE
jgi:hypothetical protein